MRYTMFTNYLKMRNLATVITIFLFMVTLLFTAGCSDVGFKQPTFDIWVLKIDADGEEQWNTIIDGDPDGVGIEMIQTLDGGYAIAGTGTRNGSIVRIFTLDAKGDPGLDLTIDPSPDSGRSLVEAPGGGYTVTTRGECLKRIDESGTVLWSTKLGGVSDPLVWEVDKGWRVVRAPDGGYAATGNNRTIRLDEDGTILWESAFDPDKSARTIIAAPTGGFVTGGVCDVGVWVTMLDAEGNSVWNRTFPTESPPRLYSVRFSPDGTYDLIYGARQHVAVNDTEHRRLTETTEVSLSLHGEQIGEKPVQVSQVIVATEEGGYAYCGYSQPQFNDLILSDYPGSPLRVVRRDNVGEVVWDASFDIGEDGVTSIIQTADGGFAIFGKKLDF